mmetsp:Transcript_14475/g.29849  ORF Transcript_14475/g.29849 Transcript_14475/m.29849 type:complete len:91 (-) Transcript_14475:1506-1778(-)
MVLCCSGWCVRRRDHRSNVFILFEHLSFLTHPPVHPSIHLSINHRRNEPGSRELRCVSWFNSPEPLNRAYPEEVECLGDATVDDPRHRSG